MSTPVKPSRLDFDNVDTRQIEKVLRGGTIDSLTPAEQQYYSLMELVRGLRARMLFPGGERIVTKAGIIKLLKSDLYGLTDWMARQVYADALNFFYSDTGVSSKAWANLYAERYEKWADMAAVSGNLRDARGLLQEAAKLRGCFDAPAEGIPDELLNQTPVVIYTADPATMGAPKADRKALEQFIDTIPDLPEVSRRRVKEDAGISPRNLLARMNEDIKEFSDEKEEQQ